ncbi:MAG: PEP-CTERM sorting domain-containing protein [Armatimonadetes bacterium]|nr:PEP-CTERM sorting domain-containing protein [Armatimonadota bacterium]
MALVIAAAALAGSASASILYINYGDGSGSAYASQNDTNTYGNYATVYGSFNAVGTVTHVEWLGEYFNPAQQGALGGFTLNFYSDAGGNPGGLVSSQHFNGTCNEFWAYNWGGFDVYDYSTDISGVAVNGDGWLSIVADLGFPPQWGWTAGQDSRFAQQDFFGSRSVLGTSVSMALSGDTAVPEPASMAALGLGVVALIRKRKAAK